MALPATPDGGLEHLDPSLGEGEPDPPGIRGAARAALFRIDERYQALPAETRALRAAARRLAALQAAARTGAPGLDQGIEIWLTDSQSLERRLAAREAQSLYVPAHLTRLRRDRP